MGDEEYFQMKKERAEFRVTIVSKYLLDLHEKIYCNYIHMYIYIERERRLWS